MNELNWIDRVRRYFLDPHQVLRSLLNLTTAFLILWAINPESIYYDWKLWSVASGAWSVLAILLLKERILGLLVHHRLWIIGVWPAYTLMLWIIGRGLLHRKFIAVAFMMAVGFYYVKAGMKKDLAVLARLGILYLSLIALTTLIQMISHPTIARDLAVGRGVGNFRASVLLGNFHTIYESVLLGLALAGLMRVKTNRSAFWFTVTALNGALILSAQYDIAIISLILGGLLLAVWFILTRGSRSTRLLSAEWDHRGEVAVTAILYTLPAAGFLIFDGAVRAFITRMDYNTLEISEKLFNRIWVYLRSLFLFLEYPLLGYGFQADLDQIIMGQHSDYLDILSEYGLIGFVIFLLSYLALFLMMRQELNRPHQALYWISVIVFHILMILNPVLEVSSVTVLFLLLPGLFFAFEPTSPTMPPAQEGVFPCHSTR